MFTPTIEWVNGRIRLIDQTLLPNEFKKIYCDEVSEIWQAIKTLKVRGAPAIGIAAAFGTVLGIWHSTADNYVDFETELKDITDYLSTSRPTAVNLFWALKRMVKVAQENKSLTVPELKERLLAESLDIMSEDQQMSRSIGKYGAGLIENGDNILTHCNAGLSLIHI